MRKLSAAALLCSALLVGCSTSTEDNCATYPAAVPEACVEQAAGAAAYSLEREVPTATEAAADYMIIDEPMISVEFTQYTDSLLAEDGCKLFTGLCYVPHFSTSDDQTNRWLADAVEEAVQQTQITYNEIRQQAQTVYNSHEGDDFYAYSYYCNVNAERLDSKILSVVQVNSAYSGGTHPDYDQIAFNLDLEERMQLSLADVILPDSIGILRDLLLQSLQDQLFDAGGLFPNYQQTVVSCFAGTELTPDWYFSDNGLVIYFNCNEIASYAAGIVKAELPYSILDDVIRPEYLPTSRGGGEGSAVLMASADDCDVKQITTDGTMFYIGTDGAAIYNIKVFDLSSWVTAELPVVGQMLFAANRLTGEEVLALAQPENVRMPEYLLTYRSAAGELYSVAVSPGEMRNVSVPNAK